MNAACAHPGESVAPGTEVVMAAETVDGTAGYTRKRPSRHMETL